MKSILFIHRSVGQNLLDDGKFSEAINATAKKSGVSVKMTDINNNLNHKVPGLDTKPADYLDYFHHEHPSVDLLIIKSCYPNSAIKSDEALEFLKQTYTKLVEAFLGKSPGKLLIMTTPPLRPARTNKHEAKRARSLATWLAEERFDDRVSVFDFYDLLAESDNPKDKNMLKKQYRRLAPWDNHPNRQASITISPELARVVVSLL